MPVIAGTSARCLRRASLRTILFLSLSMLITGCAHHPKDSLLKYSGKTVLVMKPASIEEISIPGKGLLSASGRGASAGATMGAEVFRAGEIGILLMPAFATVGALGGAIYGAAAAEPREQWQAAEALFTRAIADADIVTSVAAGTASHAAEHGYHISVRQPASPPPTSDATPSSSLAQEGFDTELVISDLSVALVRAEGVTAVRPNREVVLQARARLVTTADQTVLADNVIRSGPGSSRCLEAWSADNAKAFREELREASRSLAENILAETFMLYRFPKKVKTELPFLLNVEVRGLAPSYPPLPDTFTMIHDSLTLQPEFQWERFDGQQVSYDLKVWDVVVGIYDTRPGAVVYQQEGLTHNAHRLDFPLLPSQTYFWSVRAHFSVEGKRRVTEWSQYRRTPGLLMGIMTIGIAYAIAEDSSYYRFRTPSVPALPDSP